jgi:hypothetical protein
MDKMESSPTDIRLKKVETVKTGQKQISISVSETSVNKTPTKQ